MPYIVKYRTVGEHFDRPLRTGAVPYPTIGAAWQHLLLTLERAGRRLDSLTKVEIVAHTKKKSKGGTPSASSTRRSQSSTHHY